MNKNSQITKIILRVGIRVKTEELKKHYQERYIKLEEEEAEKFHQAKVENC